MLVDEYSGVLVVAEEFEPWRLGSAAGAVDAAAAGGLRGSVGAVDVEGSSLRWVTYLLPCTDNSISNSNVRSINHKFTTTCIDKMYLKLPQFIHNLFLNTVDADPNSRFS